MTDTTRRGAPLKEAALANIERKREIIREWTANGIPWIQDDSGNPVRDPQGELVLDFFPRKMRSFNQWNGSENCQWVRANIINPPGVDPLRTSNANTVKQYDGLEAAIKAELQALAAKAREQVAASNKGNVIDRLQAELCLEKRKCLAAETRYQQGRSRLAELETELKREQRAHRETTQVLNERIAELQRTIAEMAKVVPLRQVE